MDVKPLVRATVITCTCIIIERRGCGIGYMLMSALVNDVMMLQLKTMPDDHEYTLVRKLIEMVEN